MKHGFEQISSHLAALEDLALPTSTEPLVAREPEQDLSDPYGGIRSEEVFAALVSYMHAQTAARARLAPPERSQR